MHMLTAEKSRDVTEEFNMGLIMRSKRIVDRSYSGDT
jgi:hypothetical protein